eukprot:c27787_g1_i4 orf=571-1500(-)
MPYTWQQLRCAQLFRLLRLIPGFLFRDDGLDVELRVQLPPQICEEPQISSGNILVEAQEKSLSVVLRKSIGTKTLFTTNCLYGRIKPADTVWYLDKNEIFLSLKKVDREIAWPGLLEEWKTLTLGVSKLLKGTSIYLVGESTEINWAVAKELAMGLGYVPLQSSQLLEQSTKRSVNELLRVEGEDSVADAEARILSTLNVHARILVSTLGGAHGAGSRQDMWRNLHAGFTVWLSLSEGIGVNHKGNWAYENADVVVALTEWDNSGHTGAEDCLRALKYLLESQKELPDKKSLYIRLGCRGDWPVIMPLS